MSEQEQMTGLEILMAKLADPKAAEHLEIKPLTAEEADRLLVKLEDYRDSLVDAHARARDFEAKLIELKARVAGMAR